MGRFFCVAFMLVCGSCPHAAAPISGGFMTGADSAVSVFWFHPQLHAFEQGFDGEIEELNLVPGNEQMEYSIVQKACFPYMSFVTEHLVKIYPGDIFPNLPGDQYSPFGYSVYLDGEDSLPIQPAIINGYNRLCGDDPCGEEWAVNRIGYSFMPGGGLWFGMNWADSTPTAPQVKYAVMEDDAVNNLLGTGMDGVYTWRGILQSPIFRNRFLCAFEVDSPVASGWRRELIADCRPDSFLVRCYRSQDGFAVSSHNADIDTLLFFLPEGAVDSVDIMSYYNDCLDSQSLVLEYQPDMVAPLTTEIVDGDRYMIPYSFDLVVHNAGPDPIDMNIGYDKRFIKAEEDILKMGADETALIPFETYFDESDSVELIIILSDNNNQYYPCLVTMSYPPQEVTGITADDGIANMEPFGLRTYPNPCRKRMTIEFDEVMRGAVVEIFNVIGQKVADKKIAHASRIVWDGRDKYGQRLAAGVYFIRMLEKGGKYHFRRVILLD